MADDFYGNLLMEGVDLGSKYYKYKEGETLDLDKSDDKTKDFINTMLKQNMSLLSKPLEVNPLKDKVKRADAVGLNIARLQTPDQFKEMDYWLRVTNGQ